MRPSAAQLLQHERLELKAKVIAQERDLHAREAAFLQKESQLQAQLASKDTEIASLRNALSNAESHYSELQSQQQCIQARHHALVREAVAKREEELRVSVMEREEEVAAAMARREEEIMDAVRKREAELVEAWRKREEEVRTEVQEKIDWCLKRQKTLVEERERLEVIRKEQSLLETPVCRRPLNDKLDLAPSAMKGVVLTATGEPLATPAQGELAKLFVDSPKVGLDFSKIFDKTSKFVSEDHDGQDTDDDEGPPPSPCIRKSSPDAGRPQSSVRASTSADQTPVTQSARQSRLRRPSLIQRLPATKRSTVPSSESDPSSLSSSSQRTMPPTNNRPPHPSDSVSANPSSSATSTSSTGSKVKVPRTDPLPQYDLSDEENLPSPFLKRVERERVLVTPSDEHELPSPFLKRVERAPSVLRNKRPSNSNQLLKAAATNLASTRAGKIAPSSTASAKEKLTGGTISRPSVANARKASEEARKALLRP
jgi:hypothetical protein